MATHELVTLMNGLIDKLKADPTVITEFTGTDGVIKIHKWLHEKHYATEGLPLVNVLSTSPNRKNEYSRKREKEASVIFAVVTAIHEGDTNPFQVYNDLKVIQDVIEQRVNQVVTIGGIKYMLDDVQVNDPFEDDRVRYKVLNLLAIYTMKIDT
jgi:hypothetical protein